MRYLAFFSYFTLQLAQLFLCCFADQRPDGKTATEKVGGQQNAMSTTATSVTPFCMAARTTAQTRHTYTRLKRASVWFSTFPMTFPFWRKWHASLPPTLVCPTHTLMSLVFLRGECEGMYRMFVLSLSTQLTCVSKRWVKLSCCLHSNTLSPESKESADLYGDECVSVLHSLVLSIKRHAKTCFPSRCSQQMIGVIQSPHTCTHDVIFNGTTNWETTWKSPYDGGGGGGWLVALVLVVMVVSGGAQALECGSVGRPQPACRGTHPTLPPWCVPFHFLLAPTLWLGIKSPEVGGPGMMSRREEAGQ